MRRSVTGSPVLRSAILALVAAAFPGGLSAQDFEVGVWTGLAESNEVTTDYALCNANGCRPGASWPHHARRAPTRGLMVRWAPVERLGLRVGVGVVDKGYGPGKRSDRRVASRYLEASLLGDVQLMAAGPVSLRLTAGMAPAVLLSCEWSGSTVNGDESGTCDEPGEFGRYGPAVDHDAAVVIGPSMKLDAGPWRMLLEWRYTRGLIDIEPGSGSRTTNRSKALVVGFSRAI